MVRNALPRSDPPRPRRKNRVAPGEGERRLRSGRAPVPVACHYGWDCTTGTIFWIDPTHELVTILMTQSSPPDSDGLRGRFKTIVEGAFVD
jgi:CubicO group peptidase (beta-lactamase class C family)